jgi:hypothetical protein
MTNKKTVIVIFLVAVILFFRYCWQPAEWFNSNENIDLFLFYDPVDALGNPGLHPHWVFKGLGEVLAWLIVPLVFLKLSRFYMPIRLASVFLLALFGLDIVFFFLCFNTWDTTLNFVIAMVATVGYWYYKQEYLSAKIKQYFRDWYYSGWKTEHYWYLPEHFGNKVLDKLSKGQKVQECDARKDDSSSTVKYIKRNLEIKLKVSDTS